MSSHVWENLVHRFWRLAGSVSVRTKILGIVIGGTIFLSLAFLLQMRAGVVRVMEAELQARSISIARDLAARSTDLILVNDLYALHQLLLETRVNNTDLVYAFLIDPSDQVLAHTFEGGFPDGLIALNSVLPLDYQHTTPIQTNEGLVWDVAVPVFDGKVGFARIGMSNESVNRVLFDLSSQVLVTTSVVLIFSLLAAFLLTFILTRPIVELVHATRKVASGEFSHRVRRWANDEIGELAVAFNQMATELERTDEIRREREALRRQVLDGVIAAQEDERRRIARELHDSTSQGLTTLKVGLRMVETCCNDPQVHNQIQDLSQVTSQILDDVHQLAIQLRPSVLDDLGLEAALERLVQDWQKRYHIPVDITVHLGLLRLPETLETTLYRITQEALTNIARHSGAASVSVLLERRLSGEIILVIEDDGIGFDHQDPSHQAHLGLLGMRERAELLGGSLTVESTPGSGTSLFVQISLPEVEAIP